jgi:hypothetical protein
MSKSLIIIMAMHLLKAMSDQTSFVTLKGPIRASLNLINPLTSDRTNRGRKRNKIPNAGALKHNNLLYHSG